ncbi:MAG: YlbL family protein [Marmoricola sp.]
MSRRSAATLAAVLLLAVTGLLAWRAPVGYTLYSPGPTVNVLGKADGDTPILKVHGHRVYRDDGGLRLVTIYETGIDDQVSLARALVGWADPQVDVYPHDAVYPEQASRKQVRQQAAQEMTSSQDDAVAAALTALHIPFAKAVSVAAVDPEGPAHTVLRTGDLVRSVDGQQVRTTKQLVRAVQSVPPGSRLTLGVVRAGKPQQVTLTTAALGTKGAKAEQSRIGISIAPSYDFPFRVEVNLPSTIGGPSAGMMFSLGIYDVLTKGSLTHGRVVAGTGTIDADGAVGEIGGIQQKIAGAQRDGAHLFLVPAGNCAEALGADYDPDRMRLAKVSTFDQALHTVKTWAADPSADLPRCTR